MYIARSRCPTPDGVDRADVFDAEAGRNVADTLWHSTQTIAWEPDGSCLFRCTVDGLDEIVWWILGYGPHAEALQPPELRQRLGTLARALLGKYDGGHTLL